MAFRVAIELMPYDVWLVIAGSVSLRDIGEVAACCTAMQRACDEWLSNTIAAFSRDPKKRIRNLPMVSNGYFRFSDLVAVWRPFPRVSEDDVLDIVQRHVLQGNRLRFEVDTDSHGALLMRAIPVGEVYGNCRYTLSPTPYEMYIFFPFSVHLMTSVIYL